MTNVIIPLAQSSIVEALHSCDSIQAFLNPAFEIDAIASYAQTHKTPIPFRAYNRWSMSLLGAQSILLSYFKKVFEFVEPYVARQFPYHTKKIALMIAYKEQEHRTPHFANFLEERLLSRCLNTLPPTIAHLYLHPNIRYRVAYYENNLLKGSCQTPVEFTNDGFCAGISSWFNVLYFKTRKQFHDPELHLRAIASLFEHGAPPKAVLLQVLTQIDAYLRDHITGIEYKKFIINKYPECVDTEDLENSPLPLNTFPPGTYKFSLWKDGETHFINYFKISDDLGFYFDSNIGLIKLSSEDQAQDLAKKMSTSSAILAPIGGYSYFAFYQVSEQDPKQAATRQFDVTMI